MCNDQYSESGAPIAPTRCAEYLALASDRDRLAGVVAGMTEQGQRNLDTLRRAEVENARLREALIATEWCSVFFDTLGEIVISRPQCGMDKDHGHDPICILANALKEVG